MRFRSYDNLRLFDVVARHLSFTRAADELHLSKGAVSYQIRRLERELGFEVFERGKRGIQLTERGQQLWHVSQTAFRELEREIATLREESDERITIGMSSYFASRWLSPRLMTFITTHPDIQLRLHPLIDQVDYRGENIDLAIRWGKGDWRDMVIEPLFNCPAILTTGRTAAERIEREGLAECLPSLTLLHDREDSQAWADWHHAAGLPWRGARKLLVIPDPNVRVQAVIDGQGVTLNDELVADELESGRLLRMSEIQLDDYGYFLAYLPGALDNPALRDFRDWIVRQAQQPFEIEVPPLVTAPPHQ